MPTVGDVWRCYVKPSLKGLLVIRKKDTRRKSEKVRAINRKLIEAKRTGTLPAKLAHDECIKHEGWWYWDYDYEKGKWVQRCRIEHFRRLLREQMLKLVGIEKPPMPGTSK